MNGTTIVGIVVMFVGGLLISDYKGKGDERPGHRHSRRRRGVHADVLRLLLGEHHRERGWSTSEGERLLGMIGSEIYRPS